MNIEITDLKRDMVQLMGSISEMSTDLNNKVETCESLRTQNKDLLTSISSLDKDVSHNKRKSTEIQKKLEANKQEIKTLKILIQRVTDDKTKSQNEVLNSNLKIKELEEQMSILSDQLNTMNNAIESLESEHQSEISKYKENLDMYVDQMKENELIITELSSKLSVVLVQSSKDENLLKIKESTINDKELKSTDQLDQIAQITSQLELSNSDSNILQNEKHQLSEQIVYLNRKIIESKDQFKKDYCKIVKDLENKESILADNTKRYE